MSSIDTRYGVLRCRWLLPVALALGMSALLALNLALAQTSAPSSPSILVFGDSISAEYGLPRGSGWVDLLRQRLAQQNYSYRVTNASISGETTLGGRNRLQQALTELRPNLVVIELGANDGLRGQPLDAMRDNLLQMTRMAQNAKAKVILVGMRIPPNYGPDYTEKFHAVFESVAQAARVPLVPFLLEGFADQRDLFQADGIHPAAAAQPLMLDNVWKALRPLLARPADKG